MVRVCGHWLSRNTVFQIVLDLVLVGVSLALALAWLGPGVVATFLPHATLFAIGMMALYWLFGLYRRRSEPSGLRRSLVVICGFSLAVPMAYGVFGATARPALWHEASGMIAVLVFGLVAAIRGYTLRHGIGGLFQRRVMVLGTGAEAALVERSLACCGPLVRVVGFYPAGSATLPPAVAGRLLAATEPLGVAARRLKVDEIVVAVREQRVAAVPLGELVDCRLAGVGVIDLSSFFERALGQVRLDSLRASWLIFGDGFGRGLARRAVKRVFDVAVALLLLAVFWPLMLLSALAIVLEGGFPVFYSQERVGLGGRVFRVLKFRSMRSDAEGDGTPRWAARNDGRVTAVGRIMRMLRIDELPQLWNVLRGEMSLCGPRPERPFFVTRLTGEIPFYAARHSVKPGLTGWAQVRYHYGASVDDAAQKLQYDLYYVKNHSLFLDTVILFRTVGVVLTGAGAV